MILGSSDIHSSCSFRKAMNKGEMLPFLPCNNRGLLSIWNIFLSRRHFYSPHTSRGRFYDDLRRALVECGLGVREQCKPQPCRLCLQRILPRYRQDINSKAKANRKRASDGEGRIGAELVQSRCRTGSERVQDKTWWDMAGRK